MENEYIKIRGAKVHNLKNIDLDIPKNKLVVFTGVSGSGKSSLAMDTIYAEGQRRYVESLSSYARQFLGVMQKPEVESIEGLSPAIAIDQKTTSHNPRSTVGTVTEIYDYLRVLYARVGRIIDPITKEEIKRQSADEITDSILESLKNDRDSITKGIRGYILSPVVRGRKGEYSKLLDNLASSGFIRARIDNEVFDISKPLLLLKNNKHTIEAVVSRIVFGSFTLKSQKELNDFRSDLFNSVEKALKLSGGLVTYSKILDLSQNFPEKPKEFIDKTYSENFAFSSPDINFPEIEPRIFSFNTPFGACEKCNGLGTILEFNKNYLYSEELSVMQGGIFPLSNIADKTTWFKRKLLAFADVEKIDLNEPLGNLGNKLKLLLYGAEKKKEYRVSGPNSEGRVVSFKFEWEGVVNYLARRYEETDSDFVKKELERYMIKKTCPLCNGTRLKETSLFVKINGLNIYEFSSFNIQDAFNFIENLKNNAVLTHKESEVAEPILKEISLRLKFLIDVGLDYLTLARSANTLAGGEAQRIRLASQIGSGLSGVLYVLDEPSIGLHATDQQRLITTLKELRNLGNSVIVVEHDEQTMLESDYLVDFGPGAGVLGGEVIAYGTPKEISENKKSITGSYLSKRTKFDCKKFLLKEEVEILENIKKKSPKEYLTIKGATGNNLKNIQVNIPLGRFVVISGVSGSGKSTLVNETILRALRDKLHLKNSEETMPYSQIINDEKIHKVIDIDQSPIGRTPRSNPATYTKSFDEIRKIFAKTKDSKVRGFKEGRFSFNVKGGRCEACKGDGQIKVEMQFMPDIYVKCDVCNGARYTNEVLDIYYKDKNISDVLNMTVDEALVFFESNMYLSRKLQTLSDVGLGYITLGQSATTLSGGESQRVKLATELSKIPRGHTLYILDEPTTGLHFADLERLLAIFKKLVSRGNTVLVIEHNLDVIKQADYIIDLGPGGGESGGKVIFEGQVEDLINSKDSKTAIALRDIYSL